MHIRPTYGGNNANATETVNGTPAPVVNEIPALVAKPHNDHEDTQSSSPTTNGTMIHKNWPTANIPQRLLRVNKVILFRIATCSKEKRMLMKLATFSPIVASVHCLPELCYVTVCCVAVICSVQLRQGVILHRSWWSTCMRLHRARRAIWVATWRLATSCFDSLYTSLSRTTPTDTTCLTHSALHIE